MELAHTEEGSNASAPAARNDPRDSFLNYLEKVRPEIDGRILHHVFARDPGDSIDRRLEAALRHGKRMRAGLLMLIFDFYRGDGERRQMALDLAAAVEIAHAASLIVDDMLDEDDMRHGMKALHVTLGHKRAILGTIALLSYPYQIASRYGQDCVAALGRTHRAMVRAATMEMNGTPSFGVGQAYDVIIENKTGVLFGLAAQFGATAAACPPEMIMRCSEYGLLTGKVMQMADDVTDLESLLNGRTTNIGGSEAILLRCCLGQIGDERTEPEEYSMVAEHRIGSERRKDIEGRVDRYLRSSINDAEGAARCLEQNAPNDAWIRRSELHLPELMGIPQEIADMMLRERK